ncbi:MAG: methylamine utilization protein [Planctomycetes bacterium]|nr:methylamine utilization protein [Planctomycetota bacterium]
MSHRRLTFTKLAFIILSVIFPLNAFSATVNCVVQDNKGKPVAKAVISATPLSWNVREIEKTKSVIIDQIDKEFIDHVTVVQVGTTISFPNNDKIRHHVYSFSSAKTFEIPLYPPGITPEKPIVFDKPGVVVLGCNIHDWMKAYVYVLETPFFNATNESGGAVINDLPSGEYDIQVWHPRQRGPSGNLIQRVTINEGSSQDLEFAINLRRDLRPMRAPRLSGGSYR